MRQAYKRELTCHLHTNNTDYFANQTPEAHVRRRHHQETSSSSSSSATVSRHQYKDMDGIELSEKVSSIPAAAVQLQDEMKEKKLQ